MHFFFTAIAFDENENVSRQVHGPFESEDLMVAAIDVVEADYEEVFIVPFDVMVSADDEDSAAVYIVDGIYEEA